MEQVTTVIVGIANLILLSSMIGVLIGIAFTKQYYYSRRGFYSKEIRNVSNGEMRTALEPYIRSGWQIISYQHETRQVGKNSFVLFKVA